MIEDLVKTADGTDNYQNETHRRHFF